MIEVVDTLERWRGFGSFKRSAHLKRLLTLDADIIGVFAGNQGGKCLTSDTIINTCDGDIPLYALYNNAKPFNVWAYDGVGFSVATANPPFKKDTREFCVRLTFSGGAEVGMALGHRILTRSGWRSIGDVLCTYFRVPDETSLVSYLSTHISGDLNFSETTQDFQDYCSPGCHLNDGLPRFYIDNGPVFSPSQGDAQQHSYRWFCSGDPGSIDIYTGQTILPRPSSPGVDPLNEGQCAEYLDQAQSIDALPTTSKHRTFLLPPTGEDYGLLSKISGRRCQTQQSLAFELAPLCFDGNIIISYTFIGSNDVFDFEVPVLHNYYTAGLVHHNTANAAFSYIMRILGIHPIERKNRLAKQIRCLSSSLPESSDANEQDNTQYLELKRMLPPELIVKDITARSKTLVVASPTHGKSYFEFMSTKQELQDTGKVQRCVAEGQRVLMADGVWREIERIKPGDEVVCEAVGGFGDRQRTNFVENAWCNGERECLRIRCQKGIEFVVTSDHKVMVPGPGRSEYVEAGELRVGDSVVCRTNKICRVEDPSLRGRVDGEVPLFQVILTAVLLGDGTITEKQTQPKFTCKNQKLVSAIKGLLPDGIYLREQTFSNGHAPDYFIGDSIQGSNRVKDFLKEHGVWGCVANNKFVPDIIFRQSEFAVRQFLSFIFSCDGWASGHSIGYCSTSKRLAQDVFLLLRRFEIRSHINEKAGKNGWAAQYWVNICQSRDVIRFCDEIGIIGKPEAVQKVRTEAERRIKSRRQPSPDSRVPQRVMVQSITPVGVMRVYDISMRVGGWDTQQRNGIAVQRKTARTKRNNFVVQGGVVLHNCSLWEDEEPPKPFREESRRRLLTRGGDEIITLTPINGLSYLYDDVWNKRGYVWRSDAIVDALRMPKEEFNPNGDKGIACIQIATDDNPIMTKEMVDLNFASEDPDEIMVRRYGVFKQIAGRVHKSFDESVHVIDYNKYFPNGVPYSWTHARGIDYHESRTPWSIGWLSVSPENEWFVWQEFHPAIDGPHSMNTWEIAKSIVRKSMDYYYVVNLIDPLANKKQPNTLFSVTDDLNRHFESLRIDHGMGTPTMWQGWDTKATTGYNEIKARMKNSLQVKKPFSNTYRDKGETKNLPTIWFCNCPNFVRSIKLWSYEEWATPVSRAVNDPKAKRQEKHSHDNMVLEAWGKDPRLRGYTWSFNTTLHGVYSRTGRPVRSANHGVH